MPKTCVTAVIALVLAGAGAPRCSAQVPSAPTPPTASPEAAYRQKIETWRAGRDKEIAGPDGWLTLVALDWLKPGVNSFGSAADNQTPSAAKAPDPIGLFTVPGKTVQLLSRAGGFPPDLLLDGNPAR